LCDLNFADDAAIIDDSWSSVQLTISVLQEEASKLGLFINPDKCKVTTTSTWNERTYIQEAGMDLELVNDFCYLSSRISYNGKCEKDVNMWIGKAATVIGKYEKKSGRTTG